MILCNKFSEGLSGALTLGQSIEWQRVIVSNEITREPCVGVGGSCLAFAFAE